MYLVGGAEAQQQPQQTICVPTAPRPRGAARLDPLSQFRPLISESALRPSRMFRFIMLCTLQAARMASLCEPLEKNPDLIVANRVVMLLVLLFGRQLSVNSCLTLVVCWLNPLIAIENEWRSATG